MRTLTALLATLLANVALAQGAPSVVPYSGDATYTYSFPLPPARGRHQPALALLYQSSRGFSSYGAGWILSGAYVERIGHRRNEYWFVKDGERKRLVLYPAGQTGTVLRYRPEVASGYLDFTAANVADPTSWSATDAAGTVYAFTQQSGDQWLLTSATDIDSNTTTYSYAARVSDEPVLLTGIKYNYYATCQPGSCADPADAQVTLAYEDQPHPIPVVVGSTVLARHSRLATVTARNASGSQVFKLTYKLAVGNQQSLLASIQQSAGTVSLPATTFGYGGAENTPPVSYSLMSGIEIPLPQIPLGPDGQPLASCTSGASWCDALANAAWNDLDGDGRLDLVWGGGGKGIRWARNVSPPGAAVISLAPAAFIYGSETYPGTFSRTRPAGEIVQGGGEYYDNCTWMNARVFDVNGDGIADLLRNGVTGCVGLEVRLGSMSNGALSYGSPSCIDMSSVPWPLADIVGYGYYATPYVVEYSGGPGLFLRDVDGDGLVDLLTGCNSVSYPSTVRFGVATAQGYYFGNRSRG